MNKYIILLLTLFVGLGTLTAKDLSKEDKKRIKSQLKEYRKNPESYQKMIDQYKETIDSNTVQLARRKATISQLTTNLNDAQVKLTELESQLKECQNKPVPVCPSCPVPGAVPSGTIYKIQVGLFKKLDISNYLNDPKYFGIEKADDKNRYVISYFNSKEEAEKFVAELRKLGIKGAFAAKYENGERVVETKKAKAKPEIKKPVKKTK